MNIITPENLDDEYKSIWESAYTDAFTETSDPIKAGLAAWGAVERARHKESGALKNRKLGESIGGWGVLYGTPIERDHDREYFTKDTEYLTDYYQNAPLWDEHSWKWGPAGHRLAVESFDRGLWVTHVLYANYPNYKNRLDAIKRGEYAYSSDSIAHFVNEGRRSDGHNTIWPLAGFSITKSPAEPGLGPVVVLDNGKSSNTQNEGARAREALRSEGALEGDAKSNQNPNQEIGAMKEQETLFVLAEAFKLDIPENASREDVQEALSNQIVEPLKTIKAAQSAKMDGEEYDENEAKEAEKMVDVPAMLAAAGLGEDATVDELIELLVAMSEGASEEAAMSADPVKRDYNAAGKAMRDYREQMVTRLPGHGRNGAGASNKTRRISTAHRGTAKPTLKGMLNDLRAGKSYSYSTGPTGGFLLNHEVSSEILPVLRDALPLNDMGVRYFNTDGIETITIVKDNDDNEAYWVGEGATTPDSDSTLGTVTMVPRPLAARVVIPNKWLTNAVVDGEAWLREKITFRINRKIMQAALYGSGGVVSPDVGAAPLGLKNRSGVTSTSLGTNGAQPKIKDLATLYGNVEDSNIPRDDSWGFLMSDRSKRFFKTLEDSDGNPILVQSFQAAELNFLLEYPYYTSQIVPNDLTVGTSTDTSDIFFGAWSQMAIAQSNQIEFMVDPYTQSSTLQTVVTAFTYVDIKPLYEEAFGVLTGVRS